MQYPVIDLLTPAYINNGWTGLDIPNTITYEPIQLGSGEPTPDNIRPIHPAATLNIAGTNIDVYGGVLDTTNKTLTITIDYIQFSDIIFVYYNNHIFYSTSLNRIANINSSALCQIYGNRLIELTNPINNSIYWASSGEVAILRIADFRFDNETQLEAISNYGTTYELRNPLVYNLSDSDLSKILESQGYGITHRLKLPLPHYFPHPVIDALQRAAAGTQTADDTEVLRHYLTPLGIGGI